MITIVVPNASKMSESFGMTFAKTEIIYTHLMVWLFMDMQKRMKIFPEDMSFFAEAAVFVADKMQIKEPNEIFMLGCEFATFKDTFSTQSVILELMRIVEESVTDSTNYDEVFNYMYSNSTSAKVN